MFGQVLLEGMFGKKAYAAISADFAFALGQRIGRRNLYASTRLQMSQWQSANEWDKLREWLLTDLPGEDPLPLLKDQKGFNGSAQ